MKDEVVTIMSQNQVKIIWWILMKQYEKIRKLFCVFIFYQANEDLQHNRMWWKNTFLVQWEKNTLMKPIGICKFENNQM